MYAVEQREKERLSHLRGVMEEQAREDRERWVPRRNLLDKTSSKTSSPVDCLSAQELTSIFQSNGKEKPLGEVLGLNILSSSMMAESVNLIINQSCRGSVSLQRDWH